MMKRLFALTAALLALCAPIAARASVFGAPPAVPICQLAVSDIVILAPTAPAPGLPFAYRLTWQDVATWSPAARHLWGIPDGYTILSIYADRPFTYPVPRWTLIPAGADLSAWVPAQYPVGPPPVELSPCVPAPCPPPAPKPCAPVLPVCAPPAPKPCPVPPCPVPLGNPGASGSSACLGERARRF